MSKSGDQISKLDQWGWLIAIFPIKDANLEGFYKFLREYTTTAETNSYLKSSSTDFTIENVNIISYPMPEFPVPQRNLKPAALITFAGYVIRDGKATLNKELVALSVERTMDDIAYVSGGPHPVAIQFFLRLVGEIGNKWEESTPSLISYVERITKVLESQKESAAIKKVSEIESVPSDAGRANLATEIQNNRTHDTGKSPRARRRAPYSVLERVALVLYLHNKKEFTRISDGAKRFHTSTKAIADHRGDETVEALVARMQSDNNYLFNLRQRVANTPKRQRK